MNVSTRSAVLSNLEISETEISKNTGGSAVSSTDSTVLLRSVQMVGNQLVSATADDNNTVPSLDPNTVISEPGGAAVFCEGRSPKEVAVLTIQQSNVTESFSKIGAAAIFGRKCRVAIIQSNVSYNIGGRGAICIYNDSLSSPPPLVRRCRDRTMSLPSDSSVIHGELRARMRRPRRRTCSSHTCWTWS